MYAALNILQQTVTASGGTVLSPDQMRYPALRTEASLFQFVGAASEDDAQDFEFDEAKAEKLAGNHGFLKGMMKRIRDLVLGQDPKNMSTARKIALGSSILFVCTALRLAVTNPDRFGYMASQTAKLFGQWVLEMGKFVVAVLRGVGGWLFRRFKDLLQYLKNLRGPLGRASYKAAYRAGQSVRKFNDRM